MYENNEELSDFRSEKLPKQPGLPGGPGHHPEQIEPQPIEPESFQPAPSGLIPPQPFLSGPPEPQPEPQPEQMQPQPFQQEPVPKEAVQQQPFLPEPVQPDYQWKTMGTKLYAHHHLLNTLHKSMVTSDQMIHVLSTDPAFYHRRKQVQLLYECTDVCGTTFRCIMRNSPFSVKMVKMCVRVCRAYYTECSHYADTESRMTARVLLKCASECRKFSESYWGVKTKTR